MAQGWLGRVKGVVPGPIRELVRPLYDYNRRFELLSALRSDVHQTSRCTHENRYPEIFARARALAVEKNRLRILSFGCSTGEEVLTLRSYFPGALIVGAEIHELRLKACRELDVDSDCVFVKSNGRNIRRYGPYDLIFAMSVLQRLPVYVARKGIRNIAQWYPFRKFDDQISAFDGWLNIGGLIVIQNAQYRFSDSTLADRYEVCGSELDGAGVQHFDRSGELIEGESYQDVMFRKVA